MDKKSRMKRAELEAARSIRPSAPVRLVDKPLHKVAATNWARPAPILSAAGKPKGGLIAKQKNPVHLTQHQTVVEGIHKNAALRTIEPVKKPSLTMREKFKINSCKERPTDGHKAKRGGSGASGLKVRKFIRWCG